MGNIVKQTAKTLGLTYKQLADEIGYTESAVKTAIANDKVSEPMKKAVELYLRVLELESKLQTTEDFKEHLQNFLER